MDRIEAAKNTAAVKALTAYIESLKNELSVDELQQLDAQASEHVHTGVLLVDGKAMGILAHWIFVSDEEKIAQIVALKRPQGAG